MVLYLELVKSEGGSSSKLDSAVISLNIRKEPPVTLNDEAKFFSFIKACFAQRRKTLVNTVSAYAPLNAPQKIFDEKDIQRGIWNVMPVSSGDHGNAIGIGVSRDALVNFYLDMITMIESLPVTK